MLKTLLLVTQVYPPDPAAVGQYMADAAAELVRRGHRVVVLTANRGYDDPSLRYPARETLDGVEIHRLRLSSFGKRNLGTRLAGAISFVLQCQLRGVAERDLAGIVVTTVPPFAASAAMFVGALARVPITYWVMDLNPDQAVARGVVADGSLPVRAFDLMNALILRQATSTVVLDRFMAKRVAAKAPLGDKLVTIPPWPQQDHLEEVAHADNPFRREHGMHGKFVIMYSGNMSLVHPVTTMLEAAKRLRDESRLELVFIGGGVGAEEIKRFVEREGLDNIRLLPYEPLSRLKYSLSAADVHLVAMGNEMVGIVHPCKIYGAMAVARPILFLGPRPCHVSEILDRHQIGWDVRHGDVDGAVETIRAMLRLAPTELEAMGQRALKAVSDELSKEVLCGRFADVIEQGLVSSSECPRPAALR